MYEKSLKSFCTNLCHFTPLGKAHCDLLVSKGFSPYSHYEIQPEGLVQQISYSTERESGILRFVKEEDISRLLFVLAWLSLLWHGLSPTSTCMCPGEFCYAIFTYFYIYVSIGILTIYMYEFVL